MTFLVPGFLYAALAAAAAVVALHLIVTHQPRALAFPTTRFVPDVPAAATSRVVRPYDLLLLLLRVLLLLAAGSALARPVLKPRRERTARVIVADVSGSAESASEVADSVRALYRAGDVTVIFDSAARRAAPGDSIRARVAATPGSLSAALVGAFRAAPEVREGTDSVELVLVSPFAAAEQDLATRPIRSLWPGRARLVHVRADTTTASGMPVISWPASERPMRAMHIAHPDTVGAIVAGDHVVVAPFQRRWTFPPDSLRGSRVIARWVDGQPAALERTTTQGCARSILIPIDTVGDLRLRPEFVRMRAALSGACGGASAGVGLATPMLGYLAGTGRLAPAALFDAPLDVDSQLAPWLMAAALALALLELLVRRHPGRTK